MAFYALRIFPPKAVRCCGAIAKTRRRPGQSGWRSPALIEKRRGVVPLEAAAGCPRSSCANSNCSSRISRRCRGEASRYTDLLGGHEAARGVRIASSLDSSLPDVRNPRSRCRACLPCSFTCLIQPYYSQATLSHVGRDLLLGPPDTDAVWTHVQVSLRRRFLV